MNAKRVLVIGLDGATLNLIKPWVEDDRLPNIAKLIKNGVIGELESTIPPVSIPAWISFATGKNPGKLGLFDLIKRKNGSYLVQPSNPRYSGNRPIWNTLNEYGVRTGVVNVPGTFPPDEVDGFIVTGMFTPSQREGFTYPKGLKSKLNNVVGQYELDVDYWRYFNEERFLKEVYRVTEKRERAAEYLIKAFNANFFIVVFTTPDRIQHVMWKHMDANHPQHNPEKAHKYSNAIKVYWERLDRIIGKLVEAFGNEGTTILLSDHGFGPRKETFYVNDWLRKKGFLKLKNRKRMSPLVWLGRSIEKLYFLLGETSLYRFVSSLIYKLVGRELIYRVIFRYLSFERMTNAIDWARTKAFSCPHSAHFGQIYINLVERDPHGCVKPCDYEDVRNNIIKELDKLRDTITGEKMKMEIYKPEDIYSGPYVKLAPDIIFLINNAECEADTSLGHDSLFLQGSFDLRCTGTHNKMGIFIASGPGVKEGTEIMGAKIIDLAPTLLHLYGIPIPRDMDGRVLKEIFKEDSVLANREVKFTDPERVVENQVYEMSREEERKVEERLRSLGYLS